MIYEWYYNENVPYFGEDNVDIQYMETDSIVISFYSIEGLIDDSK